ncbi:hypothetical protein ACVMIX_006610 [Rhizobium leguminosarum]
MSVATGGNIKKFIRGAAAVLPLAGMPSNAAAEDLTAASMMSRMINGRIQREGEVVHLVARQLFDLSGDLVGLADRDEEFKLPAGRAMSLPMAEGLIHGTSRSRS